MAEESVQTGGAGGAVNADPFLNATQVGEYLGLSEAVKHPEQAVRALCRRRRIRFIRVADRIMIRQSWLETFIAENAVADNRRTGRKAGA